MDLENKLIGFPHVYYFNMDEEETRRVYMEKQFDNYGINYTRVSSNRFDASKVQDWSVFLYDADLLIKNNNSVGLRVLANFVSHITFLKEWYDNGDEDIIILMEDDYDLSLIDYWHFDWNYFMNHIPFDWDTIQLGYEHFERIQFFLSHKDYRSFNFGPTLINRNHVKKILDLYLVDGKIKGRGNNAYEIDDTRVSVDSSINHVGKNYTIPIITTNTDFFQDDNSSEVFKRHHINRYIYHYWWKNKRDQFSLDDFFRMNKPNDNEMTEYLQNHASRALSF